jgi:hypothetical protein
MAVPAFAAAPALGPAAALLASAALGLAGFGLAATAQAETGFGSAPEYRAPEYRAPEYHWCPGDDWNPEWGFNWEWALCHDDHHRDIDGDNHRYDRLGPPPPGVDPGIWYPLPPCGPLACWES